MYIFLHLTPWQGVGYDYPHLEETEVQNGYIWLTQSY